MKAFLDKGEKYDVRQGSSKSKMEFSGPGAGMNPKTLQYLMGHSGISVTMNTYTHLGLEDAENELRRLSEINSARVELDRLKGTDFSIESNVKFG